MINAAKMIQITRHANEYSSFQIMWQRIKICLEIKYRARKGINWASFPIIYKENISFLKEKGFRVQQEHSYFGYELDLWDVIWEEEE